MKKNLILLILISFICQTYAQEEMKARSDRLNSEGIRLAGDGKYQHAISRFENSVDLEDALAARSYNNIGYTYELAGDTQKAEIAYRKAVERGPKLIFVNQNLGKILFKNGNYQEAIKYGEKTITLDPKNKPVRIWLPHAYQKAAEERLFMIDQKNKFTQKNQGSCKNEDVAFKVGVDISSILHYDKLTKRYKIHKAPLPLAYPANLFFDYYPSHIFSVHLKMGVPYLGLLNPVIISGEEILEFRFHGKKWHVGVGATFTQMNTEDSLNPKIEEPEPLIDNSSFKKMSDVKFGFMIQSEQKWGNLHFLLFPRYLFKDPNDQDYGVEFDLNRIQFEVQTASIGFGDKNDSARNYLWFFTGFDIREYFITEYSPSTSNDSLGHYFGNYDFTFGMEFGNLSKHFDRIPFSFGIYLRERLYMGDYNNYDHATFGNGQGFFGYKSPSKDEDESDDEDKTEDESNDESDKDKDEDEDEGNKEGILQELFPGIFTHSQTIGVFAKQHFSKSRIQLRQEIHLELTNAQAGKYGLGVLFTVSYNY